jgi:Mn2+/Fe2+ NRAMP family transporter
MKLAPNTYDRETNTSTGYRNRILLKVFVITILFCIASTRIRIERVLNFVGSIGCAFTIFVIPTYIYLLNNKEKDVFLTKVTVSVVAGVMFVLCFGSMAYSILYK